MRRVLGVHRRYPAGHLGFDRRVLGTRRKVRPFHWIGPMIVKFLAAVGIAGVTPTFATDGMVVAEVTRDHGSIPLCFGIAKQRRKTDPFQLFARRKPAEIV